MILKVADILYELWPQDRYLATGLKVETQRFDDLTRRVLRTIGPAEVELPSRQLAYALVTHANQFAAMGIEPFLEIIDSP